MQVHGGAVAISRRTTTPARRGRCLVQVVAAGRTIATETGVDCGAEARWVAIARVPGPAVVAVAPLADATPGFEPFVGWGCGCERV
jgi:hypothetical protein